VYNWGMTPSVIIEALMLTAFIVFGILTYRQNKKNNKASIYIDKLLINPTPENIAKARAEAQSITASTNTFTTTNEARVRALRKSQPKLDEYIKEREDKEKK
jgi:hypothetical protein